MERIRVRILGLLTLSRAFPQGLSVSMSLTNCQDKGEDAEQKPGHLCYKSSWYQIEVGILQTIPCLPGWTPKWSQLLGKAAPQKPGYHSLGTCDGEVKMWNFCVMIMYSIL